MDSLAELNAMIDAWDIADERRRIGSRPRTVAEYFAVEQPLLRPLPEEVFETGLLLTPRVNRYSQITVRSNHYSVPAHLIGRKVRVMLHASELIIYDGRTEVARHERLLARAPTGWSWITTWRCCSASPVRCPGPPRWSRPALRESSPRCM